MSFSAGAAERTLGSAMYSPCTLRGNHASHLAPSTACMWESPPCLSCMGAIAARATRTATHLRTGMPNARARPKSASFNSPSLLISRFC
jgi:hypothetical protein